MFELWCIYEPEDCFYLRKMIHHMYCSISSGYSLIAKVLLHGYKGYAYKGKYSRSILFWFRWWPAFTYWCHLLITFANSLDPTKQWSWSGSKLFDTQIEFLKIFLKKKSADNKKKHAKLHIMQNVRLMEKDNMGHGARKPVCGGLQTTQAQTSLRIRAVWSEPLLLVYWKV